MWIESDRSRRPVDDVDIPGQPYTFRTLFAAEALGDLLSLHERGLRVVRIDLGPNPLAGLSALSDQHSAKPTISNLT